MEKYNYNWELKKAIVENGYRQNWLANKIGIDSAVLTKYITGERIVPDEKKIIIADLLGCAVNDIFREDR